MFSYKEVEGEAKNEMSQTLSEELVSSSKMKFLLPNVPKPAEFCSFHFTPRYNDKHQELKFAKGTTTLAFKFKGGVLVSVDSRSTQGPYIGTFLFFYFLSLPYSSRKRSKLTANDSAHNSVRKCEESHRDQSLSSWYNGWWCC